MAIDESLRVLFWVHRPIQYSAYCIFGECPLENTLSEVSAPDAAVQDIRERWHEKEQCKRQQTCIKHCKT